MRQFIKRILKRTYLLFCHIGVDLKVPYYGIIGFFGYYLKDYFDLKKQIKEEKSNFRITKLWPIHADRFDQSGIANGHYFHQDLLVARKIFKNNPIKHLDIGSRIDGFVAHVAAFREIEVLDIRPLTSNVKNIIFKQVDVMNIAPENNEQYDSISSLHAIEHFGLGRYGDPIDIMGSEKALENIFKMIRPGGKFYFAVPIGPQRIEFNAHRVFSIKYLLGLFDKKYNIDTFSFVDDAGDLHENTIINEEGINSNYNCLYGCGIFEMTKIG